MPKRSIAVSLAAAMVWACPGLAPYSALAQTRAQRVPVAEMTLGVIGARIEGGVTGGSALGAVSLDSSLSPAVSPVQLQLAAARQLSAAAKDPAGARAALEAAARSAPVADRLAAKAALAALDSPADAPIRGRLIEKLGAESAPALEVLAAAWRPGTDSFAQDAAVALNALFDLAARQGDDVTAALSYGSAAERLIVPASLAPTAVAQSVKKLRRYERDDAVQRRRLERVFLSDTEQATGLFSVLAQRPDSGAAKTLARLYPEIAGYLRPAGPTLSYDLARPAAGPADRALFDHVIGRAMGLKLLGLERGEFSLYQTVDALSRETFEDDARRLQGLAKTGLLPHFRAAMLFHDASKGDPASFLGQRERLAVDMAVPNKATALLLRDKRYPRSGKIGLFANLALPARGRKRAVLDELAYQLIAMRGFPGQRVRGEVTDDVFSPLVSWVRLNRAALETALTPGRPQDLAKTLSDAFYLFNAVDTAAVREGLYTDALRAQFLALFSRFERAIAPGATGGLPAALAGASADQKRQALVERFSALRRSRLDAGEDPAHVAKVFAELPDGQIDALWKLLSRYQGWFIEDATAGLTPAAQVKLVAISAVLAGLKGVDTSSTFHVNFSAMMRAVAAERGRFDRYIVRIIEGLLRRVSMEDALAGRNLEAFDLETAHDAQSLGAVSMSIDGEKAIGFDFALSALAKNLVGMLHHFESRSSVVFQKVLKEVLDLFQLRVDEFDRVHNEAEYLKTMAAGKNDKAQLMEFVKGGTVVEIGPAGGAVLELLETAKRERGDISRIIGIDISAEALKDLEARRKNSGASYELVHGDAFKLRKVLAEKGLPGASSIIFCSILHEIYSYVPWKGKKFSLDSVRAMVGEALAALEPGGRLIIRDGVMPDDGDEWQIMELKGQEELDFFKAYLDNFEGRPIPHQILPDQPAEGGPVRIRIQRKDAMEFAYTLTWGPESFPYEVREQYGVLKRDEYVKLILDAAAEQGLNAHEVTVAPEWRSYLQPGYTRSLAGKLALFSEDGKPVLLPPSNMIIVIERGKTPSNATVEVDPEAAKRHQVVLIPGDGIGPEVTQAARRIVDASGAKIDWIVRQAGAAALSSLGSPLPNETLDAIRRTGVALKGPLATPSGSGYRSINLTLRQTFGLYQNYRPARTVPGVPSVHDGVDMIVMRENLEDLYVGEERETAPGVVESVRRISYAGSERIAVAAFELARKLGRKKVTAVHKANIIKQGDGLFLKAARDVAKRYPDIAYDELIVDAAGERIARRPETLDVLLTPNVWGDILSDVAAGVSGGLGLAPSATMGDKEAIFEAVHGTAEDIAGKGIANPTAVLRSAILMLQHLGETGPATLIEKALFQVLSDSNLRTGDLGGKGNTESFTQAVIDAMRKVGISSPT